MDNPEDISLFEEYLIKNIALYFDKYEGELEVSAEEPPEAVSAEPDEPLQPEEEMGDEEAVGDEETEVPEFELQEVLQLLDIDDIVENLL